MKSLNVNEIIIDFIRENYCMINAMWILKMLAKKEICSKKYPQI